MNEEEKANGNETEQAKDETLLLISGVKGKDGEYVKKVANAIVQVFLKHAQVKLRCVGAASLNNAIKALIIAKGDVQKNGEELWMSPSFTTVVFEGGEEKTGIIIEVFSNEISDDE